MPSIDVLFVCLHGSAKSVIAVEHLLRLADARGLAVTAASAGLEPDDVIPEAVVTGLAADGISTLISAPSGITGAIVSCACRVISIGCDIPFPVARAAVRWDDIPLVSDGYAAAREAIVAKLDVLLDELETEARTRPA